jgi:predicted RNA-binding Zn ribbon-like protein
LVAGHPVLDFVNSLDWRFRNSGAEDLLQTYGDLLDFAVQAKLLQASAARRLARVTRRPEAGRVLRAAKATREVLASLFYSKLNGLPPKPESARAIEAQIEKARYHQGLSWNGACFEWAVDDVRGEAKLPIWILALRAAELITSHLFLKVRACDNPECRWLFIDRSKNQRRRWCDMRLCGNLIKSRRFKAKWQTSV